MADAIFLGSFNPPYIGHLNCIQSVLSSDIGDSLRIHIIPCKQNPNKKESVSFSYRYDMCKSLFEPLSDNVIVNDIEIKHDWKYTYDMLEYISNDNDKTISKDFLWIITEETYNELINNKWYKSDDILSKYINKMILVGPHKEHLLTTNLTKCYVEMMPGFEIHSTDIRNLIKQNKNIELYCNKEVYSIIKENNLYGCKE